MRRRDRLVERLSAQIARLSAENAALRERLQWYEAKVTPSPAPVLTLVRDPA